MNKHTDMLDILLVNGTVVSVDSQLGVIPNGAVAIRAGEIERVWSPEANRPLPPARETLDLHGRLIMPGLVNAHTHLPMTLFRGLADDLALTTWLHEYIFPAEARFISSDTVALGAGLACAEMLLGGITTCCDGYFLADQTAQAVRSAGMRAVIAQGVIDFPAPGVPDPGGNIAHAQAFVEQWKGRSQRLRPSIFCHSPYTCSGRTLQAAKTVARDLGVLFQIHVAETRSEAEQCHQAHGCSPVAYLRRLDLLDQGTLLVHAVWVDKDDIAIISESGASVAHCPESNMKLASGIAPVPELIASGIAVGLGTDGCASNNDLDLFGEMDTTAKLHKVGRLDPTVMDAGAVLRMATIGGARAIGWGKRIGSLTPGKRADLIIVDTDQPHLTPLYHPESHLVYAARAGDVSHVMVDGHWLVKDRRLLTVKLEPLMEAAEKLGRTIAGRG